MNRKRPFILIARKHFFGYTDSRDAMRCPNCGGKGRASLPEESVETVFFTIQGKRKQAGSPTYGGKYT